MHSAYKSQGKKGMGKDDFRKMQQPQLQTVLRVNMQCQCEGCRSKIRSVLKKIKGVETCKIDLEQGKVTVIGEVDPAKLVETLSRKTDKHVELWGFPKAMNMNMTNLNNNQMKNIHVAAETGKGGKGPQKQGGGGGQEMMNLHQMFPKAALNGKGGGGMDGGGDFKMPPQFKDMKMMMPPSKDQKAVKFQLPDNDFEDDDEFTDDESFDDESDDDFDGHDDHIHSGGAKNAGGGGGGGKKGFSFSNVPLLKRLGSKKEEKSEHEGGNKKGGKKGDESHNPKHGGGKNNGKKDGDSFEHAKTDGKKEGKGHGGNNGGGGGKNMKGGQKEGGGQAIDVGKPGPDFAKNMGQMGRNMGHGQMAFGANYPMGGQMGNFKDTQGIPMPGMSGGGAQYPPGMAHGYNNPYSNQQQQQQYMAMMMNQRQHQQQQQPPPYWNGMNNMNPMMYGRPMNYGPPPTPPHAMDNHFTHYFNDENTNSCSIM